MPDRCYDVGIAEAYAVTFAAGMATRSPRPFVAIYSTFFQRPTTKLSMMWRFKNYRLFFVLTGPV